MSEESVKMENVKLEDVGIGEDKPQIEPKEVLVTESRIDPVKNKEEKEVGKKVVLVVQHPDYKDKPIEISSVTYIAADKKMKTSGLWFNQDKDGKIPYRSALATMLRKFGKSKVSELNGTKIPTELDERGYLAVKAY